MVNTEVFVRQHHIVGVADYHPGMEGLGARVKAEREAKAWSQRALAVEVTRQGYKMGQSGIGNIEAGITKEPKCIPELAAALGVSPRWLRSGRPPKIATETQSGIQQFAMGDITSTRMAGAPAPSLVMWKSSPLEGLGSGEFMVFSQKGHAAARPAFLAGEEKAFGFKVVGRENEPVYRARDTLYVNPDEGGDNGDDCLFLRNPHSPEGSPAIIALLVRSTDRLWIIHQYGTKGERELPRRDWPNAWRVVARHHRQ